MQKLVPHLWFDKEAKEAADFYVGIFENSKIINTTTITDTPSGETELVNFQLTGLQFAAISAGPYFTFNPSASLMVSCKSINEVERLFACLSPDATVLMPLGNYPFSKRYAWIQDRFGVGWQLMYTEHMKEQHTISPTLLFSGKVCGKVEEAIDYYVSVFEKAKKGKLNYYPAGEAADDRAKINYGEATLLGAELVCMDDGFNNEFVFTEAFSLMVICDSQDEIDYYWDKLSYVPEAEQCGWLKDRFGVSWQIAPAMMDDILSNGTKEEINRVTEAFLKMKKFNLQELEKARLG